jgi:hypothetical protein
MSHRRNLIRLEISTETMLAFGIPEKIPSARKKIEHLFTPFVKFYIILA